MLKTGVEKLGEIASVMDKNVVIQYIIPLFIKLSDDKNKEVRLSVVAECCTLVPSFDEESIKRILVVAWGINC